ncbi:50S ribosomal protein L24 [Candidatus Babeliales bacterium]|nr:50S ribosomal protein L24 [Candidatus Babeliales bacterium]
MLARIRKDDLVSVLSGRDKGKQGHVIKVDPSGERVLVKGVGMVTKHVKARRQGESSKITKEESYLPLCRVMPVCPACKKACRVQIRVSDDKKRTRSCARCKEAF